MTHLTDPEMVDLLDDSLSASRSAHLDDCARCRETAAALRDARTRAEAVDVPEPSPLFWEMFSMRVHDAVRDAAVSEPGGGWLAWTRTPGVKWALSGALLTLLLVAGVWEATAPNRISRAPRIASAVVPETSTDAVGFDSLDPAADPDPADDVAWDLVRTVADDVSWDDGAVDRMGMRPGSAERAVDMLTTAERTELARLLEAELKQPGA
jgi:hypothetical protein